MNKYRRYLPIIAVVLAALGLNLDRIGIDLEALGRGESPFTSQGAGNSTLDSNPSNSASRGRNNDHAGSQKWSDTSPNINLFHIFDGEINRSGKPVGFHSRPGGQDPGNARLVSIKDGPNRHGIYTASIEIRDGNQWKSKFSSFFPDSLSRDEVLDVIVHAYSNSSNPNAQPWDGPSGEGYRIQGYTSGQGGINTAFPVYTRN